MVRFVKGGIMLIDCDRCEVRGLACSDCVVSVLLGHPDHCAELDGAEQDAIGVLAQAGMVPPLRLVVRGDPHPTRAITGPGLLPRARSAG